MARSKGTHYVITANTTDDGAAVYRCRDGRWTPRLSEAEPIVSDQERDVALAEARRQEREVCDPYAFRVVLGPEGPQPTNNRERIRDQGPSSPLRQTNASSSARLSA